LTSNAGAGIAASPRTLSAAIAISSAPTISGSQIGPVPPPPGAGRGRLPPVPAIDNCVVIASASSPAVAAAVGPAIGTPRLLANCGPSA
jgi:hypothetical protein